MLLTWFIQGGGGGKLYFLKKESYHRTSKTFSAFIKRIKISKLLFTLAIQSSLSPKFWGWLQNLQHSQGQAHELFSAILVYPTSFSLLLP